MLFNQVSVSFCFRMDGTFFFLKHGQHLRQSFSAMSNFFCSKRNLLCTAVETDHDQQEYEEEECESGEGIDYRSCGGVGHHPDNLLLRVRLPRLEGSFRGPWACLQALAVWAYGGVDRGGRLLLWWRGGYCHLLLPPLTLAPAPPHPPLPLRTLKPQKAEPHRATSQPSPHLHSSLQHGISPRTFMTNTHKVQLLGRLCFCQSHTIHWKAVIRFHLYLFRTCELSDTCRIKYLLPYCNVIRAVLLHKSVSNVEIIGKR